MTVRLKMNSPNLVLVCALKKLTPKLCSCCFVFVYLYGSPTRSAWLFKEYVFSFLVSTFFNVVKTHVPRHACHMLIFRFYFILYVLFCDLVIINLNIIEGLIKNG